MMLYTTQQHAHYAKTSTEQSQLFPKINHNCEWNTERPDNTVPSHLSFHSAWAMAIKKDIAFLIAADMRPFSILENRQLLHTLDPKYSFPSHVRFTPTVVSKHYKVCISFHHVFSTAGDIVKS